MCGMEAPVLKSVPLDDSLAALATAICTPNTPERAAVESITGPLPAKMTEAAALNTLLTLAKGVVADAMAYTSYASEAAAPSDDDHEYEQWSRGRRARRDREAWA